MVKWDWSDSTQSGTAACWLVPRKIGAIIFSECGFPNPPLRLTIVCLGVRMRVDLNEKERQDLKLARRRAQRILLWLERGSRRKKR